MGFLIQSILVYCLIALLIGGVIGWILKSFVCERDCEAKVGEWEAKYNALDGRYKTLQASGSAAGASGSVSVDADAEALRGQIAGLEETNRLQANRISDLEGELNSNVQGAMAGEDLSARVELLEQDLSAARNDNAKLNADLAAARDASAEAGESAQASAQAAAQVSALSAQMAKAEQDSAKLNADLAACQAAQADLAAKAEQDAAQLNADLAACKSARTDLEAKLKDAEAKAEAAAEAAAAAAAAKPRGKKEVFTTDAPAPTNLMTSRPDQVDDLKEIWGVGPVMEGVLNKLGIYKFKQVSELSDRDVEWVSANIGTFPDRIKRDEWVRQAGELHQKHHG